MKPTTAPDELKLKLTPEQQEEIVRYIAATGDSNLQINIQFEADPNGKGIAPVSVLVGNAI